MKKDIKDTIDTVLLKGMLGIERFLLQKLEGSLDYLAQCEKTPNSPINTASHLLQWEMRICEGVTLVNMM